eukprot:scaffold5358_cov69-Skeletonema_menzelii.AAC.1
MAAVGEATGSLMAAEDATMAAIITAWKDFMVVVKDGGESYWIVFSKEGVLAQVLFYECGRPLLVVVNIDDAS